MTSIPSPLRYALLSFACVAAAPGILSAQSAHDESGVIAAVREVYARHRMPEDSTREGPDSATIWQRFVRCDALDGRNVCALTEGKPAFAFGVRMITADSAVVSATQYYMVRETCGGAPLPTDPHRGVIDPPIISHGLGLGDMTFVYRDGRWINVGKIMLVTC